MREVKHEMNNAVRRVQILKDRKIIFKINTGRNNFLTFEGKITQVYPSVFVIKDDSGNTRTFSYNDVITKCVRFYPLKNEEAQAS